MKTFIIAEIGVNHNGDLKLAYELIDRALEAGADAVKFQTAIPSLIATNTASKAKYQKRTTDSEESQLKMLERLMLPLPEFDKLFKYCVERKIIFFSTAFDMISLNYLEKIGQPYHKVPSGDITNLPYLRQMGSYGRPVILSTGMSNFGEIESAIEILESAGTPRSIITVLHCNTEYPTPMADVNLRAMTSIGNAFGVNIGYSDHTEGIEISVAAVALGATMIEKHLTLDKNMEGPDHRASIEPTEFKKMVQAIRNIEVAMGDGVKRSSASESKNIAVARRSIVALKSIQNGELFSEENITTKRPGTGISPMHWDQVVGKHADRDYDMDEMIELPNRIQK